jgi:hypothetical protein
LLPASVYSNGSIAFNTNPGSIINATILIAIPQLELNPNIPAAVASAVTGGANGSGGVGYLVNDTGTITTTNGGTAATYKVTGVSGTAVTTVSITAAGSYTVDATHGLPASPAATVATSGVGTGLTLTLTPVDNSAQGFSTPPILTSSGALARAADRITLPTVPCNGGASLYVTGIPASPTANPNAQFEAEWSGANANNRLYNLRASGGTQATSGFNGSYAQVYPSGSWAQNVSGKSTSLATAASLSGKFNGGTTVNTSSTGAPVRLTTLTIGGSAFSNATFNGTISRVAVSCGQSLLNQ